MPILCAAWPPSCCRLQPRKATMREAATTRQAKRVCSSTRPSKLTQTTSPLSVQAQASMRYRIVPHNAMLHRKSFGRCQIHVPMSNSCTNLQKNSTCTNVGTVLEILTISAIIHSVTFQNPTPLCSPPGISSYTTLLAAWNLVLVFSQVFRNPKIHSRAWATLNRPRPSIARRHH